MDLKKYTDNIIALGVVIGMVVGGMAYFAKAKDLEFVELRLEQKIQYDKSYNIQEEIFQLEKKYTIKGKMLPCEQWQEIDKKRYQRLQYDLDLTKKQLEKMK